MKNDYFSYIGGVITTVAAVVGYVKSKNQKAYDHSSSGNHVNRNTRTDDDVSQVPSTSNTGSEKTIVYNIIGNGTILIDSEIILGEGKQGKVYRGEFENIPVAVKEILDLDVKSDKNDAIRTRVRKANQTLLQSPCENIVRYFCCDTEESALYICMELCKCNLEEFIRTSSDSLPDNSLEQVLKGLEFLHKNKLLHRDIKPSNVLVTTNISGEIIIKLSDFSISKAMSRLCGVESVTVDRSPSFPATCTT